MAVLYTQRAGAVDRILSLLRRRGFPVGGVTLERTHRPEIGRMTVVVTQPGAVTQMSRHLSRLPDIVEVAPNAVGSVQREYAMARIGCRPQERAGVMLILEAFQARALSVTDEHLVLEAAGDSQHLDSLLRALAPYHVEDLARTSTIAMAARPAGPHPP